MVIAADLLHQIFRSNPRYRLVGFDELSGADRAAVADLARQEDAFGILRPRGGSLGTKSASRPIAALVRCLRTPRRLPSALRRSSADMHAEIARLVLDGVLEVRHEGRFVCGAAAAHLLPENPAGETSPDRIASLSLDAVRYAAALPIDHPSVLSARMYFYNRVPATPGWAQRLPSVRATADFLGFTKPGEPARLLRQHWRQSAEVSEGWFIWSPRRRQTDGADRPTHKLYISPAAATMPEVLRIVVRTLATRPTLFKVGSNVHGLLRPDKLLVYVESREELEALAATLAARLHGTPVHGVPFTEPLTRDGLLSAGVDPPRSAKILAWHERESWRLWTTNRLAVYLLTARATPSPAPSVTSEDFALARLRLDGVDTTTWSPSQVVWSPHLPEGRS